MLRDGSRTKLGQKAEMFWMETRPTKSDIGKTQKMVKALRKVVKLVRIEIQKPYQTPRPITQSLKNWIRR